MTQKKSNSVYSNFSISKILREKNKSNDYFELMLGNITLEDLIALKLEICFKSIGIPLHGIPLWETMPYIARNAVLKYALSATGSRTKASVFLNLPRFVMKKYLSREDVIEYFNREKK